MLKDRALIILGWWGHVFVLGQPCGCVFSLRLKGHIFKQNRLKNALSKPFAVTDRPNQPKTEITSGEYCVKSICSIGADQCGRTFSA